MGLHSGGLAGRERHHTLAGSHRIGGELTWCAPGRSRSIAGCALGELETRSSPALRPSSIQVLLVAPSSCSSRGCPSGPPHQSAREGYSSLTCRPLPAGFPWIGRCATWPPCSVLTEHGKQRSGRPQGPPSEAGSACPSPCIRQGMWGATLARWPACGGLLGGAGGCAGLHGVTPQVS